MGQPTGDDRHDPGVVQCAAGVRREPGCGLRRTDPGPAGGVRRADRTVLGGRARHPLDDPRPGVAGDDRPDLRRQRLGPGRDAGEARAGRGVLRPGGLRRRPRRRVPTIPARPRPRAARRDAPLRGLERHQSQAVPRRLPGGRRGVVRDCGGRPRQTRAAGRSPPAGAADHPDRAHRGPPGRSATSCRAGHRRPRGAGRRRGRAGPEHRARAAADALARLGGGIRAAPRRNSTRSPLAGCSAGSPATCSRC